MLPLAGIACRAQLAPHGTSLAMKQCGNLVRFRLNLTRSVYMTFETKKGMTAMKRIFASVALFALIVSCFAQTGASNAEEPDTNIIAVVLGRKITAAEKDKLNGLIFSALLRQYAAENKIEPTEEELDAFVLKTEQKEKQYQVTMQANRAKLIEELKNPSLSARDREQKTSHLKTIESILKTIADTREQTKGMEEQMRLMRRQMARRLVTLWKINKALYGKYGGRVIFQQAGAEPLDAYRDFLKEHEKNGAFQIIDKQYEPEFWRYFTNDAMHAFYPKDEGARFINTPWWMMEEASANEQELSNQTLKRDAAKSGRAP